MNTMLFWDPTKRAEVRRVKITQSKGGVYASLAHTRRSAFALAARQGWEHITIRTWLNRLRHG